LAWRSRGRLSHLATSILQRTTSNEQHAPCTSHLANLAPCTLHLASYSLHLASYSLHLAPRLSHPAPSTSLLASHSCPLFTLPAHDWHSRRVAAVAPF
jgi:hypothetical protein